MLHAAHLDYLAARGVTEATANACGVRSVESPGDLTALTPHAFSSFQGDHVPGILFQITSTRGQRVGWQYRADTPRLRDNGDPVKFDNPRGQPIRLHVPLPAVPLMMEPNVPLIITEGPVKAMAAWSRLRLPAIALTGVSAGRGRPSAASSTQWLPDWQDGVELAGREVWLCFDHDVVTNANVWSEANKLAGYLGGNLGARVRHLALPGEGKEGLDDYLSSLGVTGCD